MWDYAIVGVNKSLERENYQQVAPDNCRHPALPHLLHRASGFCPREDMAAPNLDEATTGQLYPFTLCPIGEMSVQNGCKFIMGIPQLLLKSDTSRIP